jgi:hypothetical protein
MDKLCYVGPSFERTIDDIGDTVPRECILCPPYSVLSCFVAGWYGRSGFAVMHMLAENNIDNYSNKKTEPFTILTFIRKSDIGNLETDLLILSTYFWVSLVTHKLTSIAPSEDWRSVLSHLFEKKSHLPSTIPTTMMMMPRNSFLVTLFCSFTISSVLCKPLEEFCLLCADGVYPANDNRYVDANGKTCRKYCYYCLNGEPPRHNSSFLLFLCCCRGARRGNVQPKQRLASWQQQVYFSTESVEELLL